MIKITNDTSTLNGSLLEMKDQLISELANQGVTATYDPTTGLLGLIAHIADIQGGGATVDSLTLTTNKSILSYYDSETATLTATATDSNNQPVSGATLLFVNGTTIIGSSTTNNNGIATLTYTSTGTGDSTIYATTIDVTSNTITIEDIKYYDALTTNKGHWTIPSGANVSFSSTGMLCGAGSWNDLYLEIPITKPCEITYDIVQWTGTNSYHFYLWDNTKSNRLFNMYKVDNGYTAFDSYPNYSNSYHDSLPQSCTVKIVINDTSLDLYVDDDLKVSKTYTITSPLIMGFITATNRTTTYKNLKIREL